MMQAIKKLNHLSVQDYVTIERETNTKYEYHNGVIHAMAGGTLNHGLICGNMFGELRNMLRENNNACKVINSQIKLYAKNQNSFFYPDVMVICDGIILSDEEPNAVTNPVLIIEVLSKHTAAYDRGEKFYKYRSLSSFKEYVLIEQNKPYVDRLYRDSPSYWNMATYIGLDKEVELLSLDISIPMSAIYEDVNFEI